MKNKKSLLKFTDAEKLETVKEIREFVNRKPKRANEVVDKLQEIKDLISENTTKTFKKKGIKKASHF